MEEKEKNSLLNELIDELCKKDFSRDKDKINLWITKLNKIYANNYRHTYSDIFLKIQTIISKDNSETLEILGENLNVLGASINLKLLENSDDANLKNTSDSFKKFSDHINLEIGRYNFLKAHFENNKNGDTSTKTTNSEILKDVDYIKQKLDVVSKDVDNIRPITTQAQKELDNLDSKLENNKISSITTLTIFSAVVLAFSGGITFEAGIFKGMAVSSSYRLIFTIALTGFILFNTIFALLYLVGKLSGKSISSKCKYWCKSNDKNLKISVCNDGFCNKQCHSVSVCCRIFHKYSYVAFINIILIWTMYIDFLLWFFRNQLTNPIHIICQIVPVIFLLFIFLCTKIYNRLKIRRMKLKFKIGIIMDIVSPEENKSVFYVAIKTISNAFLSKQTVVEKFINDIAYDSFNEAIKRLDRLANETITYNKQLFPFISSREHKFNKKYWKELENKFSDYMAERELD